MSDTPEQSCIKDYRLTVKVRNNRILTAIADVGGTQGAKWCAENGLSYVCVNNLINMTKSPIRTDGVLSETAEKLCNVLNKLPTDLWSNEQIYPLERNFSEMEMDYAQLCELLPTAEQSYLPDFSEIEQEQTKAMVNHALGTLPSKLSKVLRMRFEDDLTFKEIGEHFGVSVERVRQLEAKAMRLLRHPARAARLSECVSLSEKSHQYYRDYQESQSEKQNA